MSKPLSLFSDQDLAAARAQLSKAADAGELEHLNPDGTKKHKQLTKTVQSNKHKC